MFILVFQPDQVGIQVPLLATWLVLDRAGRRWWTPVVIGVMLAWLGVADRLLLLIGAVPLAAVCAVRAYQSIVVRREPQPAQWFNLSLIAAAAAAAAVASAAGKLIGQHGGYALLPVASGLAPASAVPNHAWLAVQSAFGLYGADLAALGCTAAQPPVPAVGRDLAGWLAAHHLSDGLASYGLANSTTLASGGAVAVRPVTWHGTHAAEQARESDRAWYDPVTHDATFLVLLANPAPLDPIADWQARDPSGRPPRTYRFGRYVIMTWDANLLLRLSPSSRTG